RTPATPPPGTSAPRAQSPWHLARMSPHPVAAESAAEALRAGGIVAHPAEAVWGLACDPRDEAATLRLLALKRREVDKGLILVAGSLGQLNPFIHWDALPDADRKSTRLNSSHVSNS